METPNKQSFEAKHKAALTNVYKTVTAYKKVQNDEKELGAQLKLLKVLNTLWEINDEVAVSLAAQGQILSYAALGYKALGLDRDAINLGAQLLNLESQLLEDAASLPGAKGTKAQEQVNSLVSEIKALNRSCSRRPFDLSVRTINIDLFIHVKSFIDYFKSQAKELHSQIITGYQNNNVVDAQITLKLNRLFKLLKLNASCSVQVRADDNQQLHPTIILNLVNDDAELAYLYAAFLRALPSYGAQLQEFFEFDLDRALLNPSNNQQSTVLVADLALSFVLEHTNTICPAFLKDSESFTDNSRKLDLQALTQEDLNSNIVINDTKAQEALTENQANNSEPSETVNKVIKSEPNLESCGFSFSMHSITNKAPAQVSPVEAASIEPVPTQDETVETTPVEPTKTQEEASEAASIEPAPTQDETVETTPVKPTQIQEDSSEVASIEPALTQDKTVETTPVEPTQTQEEASEAASIEPALTQDKTVETTQTQEEASEVASIEPALTQDKTVETTPVEPTQTQEETVDNTKVVNKTPIVASNAYKMPQDTNKGGLIGFFRRMFGRK